MIHTGLITGTEILPIPFVCDATGAVSFTFHNTLGIPDVLGVQVLVTGVGGEILGTSTTDFL